MSLLSSCHHSLDVHFGFGSQKRGHWFQQKHLLELSLTRTFQSACQVLCKLFIYPACQLFQLLDLLFQHSYRQAYISQKDDLNSEKEAGLTMCMLLVLSSMSALYIFAFDASKWFHLPVFFYYFNICRDGSITLSIVCAISRCWPTAIPFYSMGPLVYYQFFLPAFILCSSSVPVIHQLGQFWVWAQLLTGCKYSNPTPKSGNLLDNLSHHS